MSFNDKPGGSLPPDSPGNFDGGSSDVRVAIPEELEKSPITADEKEKEKEKGGSGSYWRIFTYASTTDRILYVIAVIMAIASGAALPLMTIVFGQFTTKFNNFARDPSQGEQFMRDINSFVLYFIYFFVGRFSAIFMATSCATIAATRTVRSLREEFLKHLLRMDISHFDKSGTGKTASQVTSNANRINSGIAQKLVMLIQAISMFFASFIVALAVQWKLALITLVSVIPATMVVAGICFSIDEKIETATTKIYSQASELAQEAFSSIRAVQAFSAQDRMMVKYEKYLVEAHRVGDKKSPLYLVFFPFSFFFTYAGTALAFWQGYRMFRSGEIPNVGTVFTVQMAMLMATAGLTVISPYTLAISSASAAAAELFEVIDKPSQLDSLDTSGDKPDTCHGDIEISHVSFAYPTRPSVSVMDDFSLRFPAGKTTALVGASGSGKSTCVGLLERWYEPLSGSIRLDGKELCEYNIKWLRSQVRLVQQEPVLFSGTVFENVAGGFLDEQRALPDAQQRELVREACVLSNAHDFISQLPNGYDTQVGERAGKLSGGQKQRLAIARSIISQPKVLLLDEATSALDPVAEAIVQDALNRVSKGRTTITIAHRLSTIQNADKIAVVSNGQVVEEGTHKELIALDRHYAALVRAQDLGENNKKETDHQSTVDTNDHQLTALKRTITAASQAHASAEAKKAATEGTLHYGMFKCIWLLFSEQPDMTWKYALAICLCAMAAAVYPVQAILFSRILNVFTLPRSEADSQANFWALMFFVVALNCIAAYAPLGWLANTESQKMSHRYRREAMHLALHQDMTFYDHEENSSGALAAKIDAVPQDIVDMMSLNASLMVVVIINVIGCSVLGLAYGWKLSLVVLAGGMLPLAAAGYYAMRLESQLDESNGERFASSASVASEAVGAIRTIASLTMERQVLKKFNEKLSEVVTSSFRTLAIRMMLFSVAQSLDFLSMALGFWYGARLLARGEYTITQFYVIFLGVIFAGQAAGQFFGFTGNHGPDGDSDLILDDVHFAYPQQQQHPVLKGIDINISPSQFIALVGASGCGKSTVISLLERFYDPTSGRLLLHPTDIKSFSPTLYRSHFSLVQQEPTLYQGSIRDNIALGLPISNQPTNDDLIRACTLANAHDFIMSLPEGLDTPCGAHGSQFSGGQRQRIAIARALIRNPRVLLLDEATSALDTLSERMVQAAIDDARRESGRITVAVAHRLSTVVHADAIYVFDAGRIVEQGTHQELLAKRGRYFQMCLAQSLDRGVS
ncbi:hypothetical protein DRE_07611 [Drechslerella stenobrocha 248]|uniref:Leptomycin B resistance protein pmd1 n=1 Tax=Drechslerella stenobrocha 248 TaxID=1043628 RepID=W7I3W9_9PEZI|nr:hypothetical protein DRE_07611 [Drechslerella stenobrocha 248]